MNISDRTISLSLVTQIQRVFIIQFNKSRTAEALRQTWIIGSSIHISQDLQIQIQKHLPNGRPSGRKPQYKHGDSLKERGEGGHLSHTNNMIIGNHSHCAKL